MTPSQRKRLTTIFKVIQDVRRSLDKEAAAGMTGIGAEFGTEIDINDAIFGIVYAEKAIARMWEREDHVRVLPEKSRELIRLKPKTQKGR